MAKEIYRIVTAEGLEFDYHLGLDMLKQSHPGAKITRRRVLNEETGEGMYEPWTLGKAEAAQKREAAEKEAAKAPAQEEAPIEEAPVEEAPVEEVVVVEETPAKSAKKK